MITATETVPAALQARYRASVDKDTALAELVTLEAALDTAKRVERITRQLMHLVAANEPRLAGALTEEIAMAIRAGRTTAHTVRRDGRDANWRAKVAGLITEIETGMGDVSAALKNYDSEGEQ